MFRATVLIGVCSMAAPLAAQSSLPIAVDQRVRVETVGSTITGRVVSVMPDTLRLDGSSVGKAAALGAWSGGLFGGLIGAGIGASRGGDRWEQVWP